MKKQILFFSFLVGLFFASCQEDSIALVIEQQTTHQTPTQITASMALEIAQNAADELYGMNSRSVGRQASLNSVIPIVKNNSRSGGNDTLYYVFNSPQYISIQ